MSTEDAPRTLRRRMGLGVALFAAVSVASRGLALVTLAALARLLTPEDFGLVAYAAFATGLMTLAIDRHLEMSLIRMGEVDQAHVDTVFTLRLAYGIALAALAWALADPVAAWLDLPQFAPVLRALAAVPVLSGLFNPRFILFEKQLAFGRVAQAEVAMQAASTALAVALAFATGSHWAAVAGMIAASAVRTGLSWSMARGPVGLGLRHAGETVRYSSWLVGGAVVTFLNGQVNRLFAGAFLGLAALGQFRLGAELAQSAVYFVQRPMIRVAYPGLAEARAEGRDLGEAFLRFQAALMLVVLPVAVLIAVAAPWIVRVVAGAGWQDAVPVLQILSLLTSVQALMAGTQSIVLVDGRTWLSFGRQVVVLLVSLPLMWLGGSAYGLAGILAATVAAQALAAALTLLIIVRVAGITLDGLWRALRGALLASAAAGAAASLAAAALPEADRLGFWGAVGAGGALGALGLAVFAAAATALWHLAGRPDGAEAMIWRMADRARGARAGRVGREGRRR